MLDRWRHYEAEHAEMRAWIEGREKICEEILNQPEDTDNTQLAVEQVKVRKHPAHT